MKNTVASGSQTQKTGENKSGTDTLSAARSSRSKVHKPPERAVYPEYIKPKREKKTESRMDFSQVNEPSKAKRTAQVEESSKVSETAKAKGNSKVSETAKVKKGQKVSFAPKVSEEHQKKDSEIKISPVWTETQASKLADHKEKKNDKVKKAETKKINSADYRPGQKKRVTTQAGDYRATVNQESSQRDQKRDVTHNQRSKTKNRSVQTQSEFKGLNQSIALHHRKRKGRKKSGLPVLSRRLLMMILIIVFVVISIVVVSAIKQKKNEPEPLKYTSSSSSVTSPVSESTTYPKGTDPLTLGSITQLVNQSHGLPQDYEPSDLVRLNLPSTQENYLRSEAANALVSLFTAAQNDGLTLICCSGFRSYETQMAVYASEVENVGEYTTKMTTAPPGYSEHQTGLSMDVTSDSIGRVLDTNFINTPEGQWLATHAWEYGFIIRYPNGMEGITGYTYEPWHIRYLGKDVAKSVYESGKTYEEYLGILD